MKFRHTLSIALIGMVMLIPYKVCAAEKIDVVVKEKTEQVEVDWRTAINDNDKMVDMLFYMNEYEEHKTLYTTTYLNVRKYPNTETGEIAMIFKPNVEVKAVSYYNGWTKIIRKGEDGDEYFYLWNEYLSEEKQEIPLVQFVQSNEYLGNFKLTAYCSCVKCCGKSDGITASGTKVKQGRTVAMYGIPFGTKLLINGHVYTVEDRGTPYGHVDIYFNSHSDALEFGVKYADVYKVN